MYDRLGIEEYLRRQNLANEYLEKAFAVIFPSYNEVQKDEEWYVLYNIYQAVRYQRHLAEFPGSKGVDSYPPMDFGGHGIPECTWESKEE